MYHTHILYYSKINITYHSLIICYILDSPHKIFIGGLPAYLNDEQVNHLSSRTSSPLFLALLSISSRGTVGQYQNMEQEEG